MNNLQLDFRYAEARVMLTAQHKQIDIYMVGCGGTGSWLAPHLARLTKVLTNPGEREISLTFIDMDVIEQANLDRQNFCQAELGAHKATALAFRYGAALGIQIGAITDPFNTRMVRDRMNRLVVVIGCVDNHFARREMAKLLDGNYSSEWYNNKRTAKGTSLVWIDCGNFRDGGQVVMGTTSDPARLEQEAFAADPWCIALPSPALLHPELLEPQPEDQPDSGLSCEEIALRNVQSLTINQAIANCASDYVLKLLTRQLRRFATYIDLGPGTARSLYTTPGDVLAVVEKKEKAEDREMAGSHAER